MQKEYWVNVYNEWPGAWHECKEDAQIATRIFGSDYRIHVKIDGGYNRYRKQYREVVKKFKNEPSYLDQLVNKKDWMGG